MTTEPTNIVADRAEEEAPKLAHEQQEDKQPQEPPSAALSKEEPKPAESEPTAEEQAKQERAEKEEQASAEVDEVLETLEPNVPDKRWIIGKSPENEGTEQTYGVYHQKPLGYFPMMRWGAMFIKALKKSMREGATDFGELNSLLSPDAGSLAARARALASVNMDDMSSVLTMFLALMEQTPDFLLDSYIIWLDVPLGERNWAKQVMEQPYDPDRDKWGLTQDQGFEMIRLFIDQNYEELRSFLAQIPSVIAEWEKKEKARASNSDQSKQ
jgi:hypothetical protein